MVKKIPIVGVDVTSNIGGTVQPLVPMFGGSAVSTNSLQSIVDSKPSIIYTDSFVLSAINIVIPKDFTRTFSDIGILSDRPNIGYSKQLSDLINSINDNRVFNFSKVVIDLVNTSDNLTRVVNFIRKPEDIVVIGENLSRIVDYNRTFQDNQSINELSRINFNKILQSTASNDDRLSILANKRLIDNIGLEDFDIIDFTKGNFETINVLEKLAVDFNKVLIDNISLDDSKIINFTKIRFDTANVLEENVIDFNKALRDNNISLGDFDIIDFTKGNFETINVLEELAVDFNKPLSNVSVIQDLPALEVSKPFVDLFTADDSDTIDFTKGNFETILSSDKKENVVFSKILSDASQPLDPLAINVEKILSDAQGTSDLDTIDFTKFNADSISTESFTSLNVAKNLFESQPNEDKNIIDFGKTVFDSITADSILRFDFVKFIADTATVEDLTNIFDGSTYAIDKTVTDFVNSNENFSKVVDFNRAFNDDQLINDLLAIDLSKILESFANGGDNQAITVSLVKTENVNIDDVFNKVVEYIRSFTDEQQGQTDSHIFDLAKALTDIVSANDNDILSVTKVLSDLSNISEISVINFNKVNNDQIVALDLFNRTVSFNRSLTEDVLQPDLPALSISKPLSDTMGYSDGPIQFDSDGWAVDYVVSGYIFDTRVIFNVIKAVTDINSTADNDFYDLAKVLFDLSTPQDTNTIDFTKAQADETTILDVDIIEFIKAPADVVIEPDGPIQFDSDGWAVDYVVSGYIFDTRVVFDVIKPLTDLTAPQDANAINFVKSRADENIILDDDDVIEFNKVLADAAIDNIDGPIQFGSDGWAVDYVVSGYIFDTRAIFDVIKVLSDINSTTDSNFYDLTKALFDLSDPQDTDTIDFTKILVDENIILDDDILEFDKILADAVIDNIDGPIQFDSNGWAVGYVVSGYIFDTRVVFDVIKVVSDTVQQPDDADVLDLNKALADFNNQSDSTRIDFTKILADTATPLDNIDVFDGSTHSFVKAITDTTPSIDSNVIEFAKALADSTNLTEAGIVSNQNYIADYFAEDYIGEVRLIA